ncbi:iron dependent repressor, metal binding and dimerization domain protein [Corynebacterium alimapuense]|uniref:Diphtheria toxin repressor n=1 Tax=Corynebacterium alimapuense TaxID=1576874 RepID=A0A3M8K9U8_9CORY|nr:iron dependent repressor, metal binding and dimerization domain protein [Corynebacterium alimapuense]RNE49304.1 metal-dependent regulator [Corynebacterium alimapuense]
MKDLVDTTEMYLRTIYELEEEGVVPLRARIAERLEQSGPTVSQTVARMERDGLVVLKPDRSLEMTHTGRELATAVMRKHRLAERLLTDVLGLDIHQVHEEACRWEHVMSEAVEQRVVAVLEDASRSPFGNPIPGLDSLDMPGASSGPGPTEFGIRAVDLPAAESVEARVVQLNEILQVDADQFSVLYDAGIAVGSRVSLVNDNGTVRISSGDRTVELAPDLAHAIRVELI